MRDFCKSLFVLTAVLLSGCGKVPTAEPGQSVEHFNGDFETGNLDGYHLLVPDISVNTLIVTNPVRKGTYALKNTLRPDDYIFNGYRAELAVYNCAKYQTEVYYGFSLMIDSAYADEQFNLLCQWQDLPNFQQGEVWASTPVLHGSSPPLALVYVGGKLELRMNENPNGNNETFLVGSALPIAKGQWYDLVFHIYWSDDNTAYTEAWMNGLAITPSNGTDNKFYRRNLFTRTGNYFKIGQYRGKDKTSNTNTIYLDEVKTGSSYSEVAP
jgi:hypothetical protein